MTSRTTFRSKKLGAITPPKMQKKGAGDGALFIYFPTSHLAIAWSACNSAVPAVPT